MILAVHSSPKKGGNLERMVRRVAQASGLEYEMHRLSEMRICHCTGCVRCARTRRCILRDDRDLLYDKIEAADGLIFGGVNYNGRFNALAHIFLERLFPLYHQEPVTRDLPAAVVAVGGEAPERAAADMIAYLRDIYFFQITGAVLFTSDTPPCFSCGMGPECRVGMPALNWSRKEFEAFTKVEKEMFQRFEDNSDAVFGCDRLGQTLAAAVKGQWGRPRSGGGFYLPSSG